MRYIPLTPDDSREMLSSIGIESVEKLFDVIPKNLRLKSSLKLPEPMGEQELMRHMRSVASKNTALVSRPGFLGAGAYNHFIPSAVDQLISRSEFFTAYTPYQPEISQGTLQAIYEFQTYVCALFGMDVANASMYDGASALAEAALMACRISRKNEIVISNLVHPRWRQVVRSYVQNRHIKVIETADHSHGRANVKRIAEKITENTAAVVVQSPNFFGNVEELSEIGALCKDKKILFVTGVAEAMSLGLLTPPGEFGADIVVGEGQSLGLSMSFGGPYIGLFATRDKYLRQMPGRISGKTTDKDGRDGYVLTLVAREQHIRREKATSNICTNQGLCALAVTVYLTLLGRSGLSQTAKNNFYAANALKEKLSGLNGITPAFDLPFFNEFVVEYPEPAAKVNKKLATAGIIGGLDLSRFYPDMEKMMLLTATELTTPEDIEKLAEALL